MRILGTILILALLLFTFGCSGEEDQPEAIDNAQNQPQVQEPVQQEVVEPEPQPEVEQKPVMKSAEVIIESKRFEPESVTINAGDSVTWRKIDELNHRIVGTDLEFNSGEQLMTGNTFSVQFDEPGTYEYRDVVFGVWGEVIVE